MAGEVMSNFTFAMTGADHLIRRVQELDKKMRRSVLMKAGRAAAKPLKATMIRSAPQDREVKPPNTWRKSVGTKVKIYLTATGAVLFFAVGPRSDYKVEVERKSIYFRDARGRVRKIPAESVKDRGRLTQRRRPVLYSHLIEPKHSTIARSIAQARTEIFQAYVDTLSEAISEA